MPELTTRVAALVSGQADLVSDIPPDQTGKIQSSGNAHVEISSLGGFVIMVKMTNYLMPGPWQDVRVRKAINYAIDMDTIIKTVLEGYGVVLGVPLEKEAFGFNPNIKWYGYDPERAKTLLREAGYANGFEMTLHAPNRRYMNDIEVMQAMAQMLSKVGIKAKVEVWEQSVYTTKWRKRELLPAYMTAWGGAGVFDGDLLASSLHSKSRPGHLQERGARQDPGGGAGHQRPGAPEGDLLEGAGDDLRGGAHHQGLPAGPHLRRSATVSTGSPGSTTCCSSTTPSSSSHGHSAGDAGDLPAARPVRPARPHREAKNRIVSTPHGAAFGERGGITDRYIRYHEEKAKGGCGMVMMFGSSSIHPTSVNDWGEVNNWDDSIIPAVPADERRDPPPRRPVPLADLAPRPARALLVLGHAPVGALRHPRGAPPRVAPRHDEGARSARSIDAWAARGASGSRRAATTAATSPSTAGI